MTDELYVCQRLDRFGNICLDWVVLPANQGVLSDLAITKAEMVTISASLCGIFAIMLAFVMIAKAVNTM